MQGNVARLWRPLAAIAGVAGCGVAMHEKFNRPRRLERRLTTNNLEAVKSSVCWNQHDRHKKNMNAMPMPRAVVVELHEITVVISCKKGP